MNYDVLYQKWLAAKRSGDYVLADSLREDFERLHGLTIFAEGDMPIEGKTTRYMSARQWHRKYGNQKTADAMAKHESKFGPMRIRLPSRHENINLRSREQPDASLYLQA